MASQSNEKLRRLDDQLQRTVDQGFADPNVSRDPLLERVRKWCMQFEVEHVHGPEEVPYKENELITLCPVKNGRRYIEPFIEHYFSLGVKHIVFLDNGSTDGTVEALRKYQGVTVLRTTLPFGKYKALMKQYLITRFARNRWCLFLDMDELFDYPFSDVLSIETFLEYLSENRYTAVAAQMLDMFPEKLNLKGGSSGSVGEGDVRIKELHRFYDISDVRKQDYNTCSGVSNLLANNDIKFYRDGIQKKLFGHHAVLTKHPLVFLDDTIWPVDNTVHRIGRARVADLTCVLLHYKFLDGLYDQAVLAVTDGGYAFGSRKYQKYLDTLDQNPNVQFMSDNTRELKNVNELVGNRFLTVSSQYLELVADVESAAGRAWQESGLFKALLDSQAELGCQEEYAGHLKQSAAELRRESAEKLAKKRGEADFLRAQIRALHNSRGWKVFSALSRIRRTVSGKR